jgi:hypothetical protein
VQAPEVKQISPRSVRYQAKKIIASIEDAIDQLRLVGACESVYAFLNVLLFVLAEPNIVLEINCRELAS